MTGAESKRSISLFTANTITAISITLVLILLGLTIIVALISSSLGNMVKDNYSITIEVPNSISQDNINNIKNQLEANEYLREVKYISKDEVKKEIIKELGSDPEELLGFDPTVSFFDVQVKGEFVNDEDLPIVRKSLEKLNILKANIKFSEDEIKDINNKLTIVATVLMVLTILLIIISFVLIRSIIQLNIYSKRFLIRTMQLVGATNSFIRKPFMWKMFWTGLFSGIFACIVIWGILYYFLDVFPELTTIFTLELLWITFVIIIGFGIIVSLLAGATTVNRYLKMDRNKLYKH